MKTLFLALLAASASFTSIAAAGDQIKINKEGGGPHGWSEIKELVEPGNRSIDCKNPGYDDCKPTPGTGAYISTHLATYQIIDILSMVDNEVRGGFLAGNFHLDDDFQVSWTAQDLQNMEVIITEN